MEEHKGHDILYGKKILFTHLHCFIKGVVLIVYKIVTLYIANKSSSFVLSFLYITNIHYIGMKIPLARSMVQSITVHTLQIQDSVK